MQRRWVGRTRGLLGMWVGRSRVEGDRRGAEGDRQGAVMAGQAVAVLPTWKACRADVGEAVLPKTGMLQTLAADRAMGTGGVSRFLIMSECPYLSMLVTDIPVSIAVCRYVCLCVCLCVCMHVCIPLHPCIL